MSRLLYIALGLAVCCAVSSCKNDDPNPSTGGGILPPPEVEDSVYNPAMTPKFVYDIKPYSGRMADDLARIWLDVIYKLRSHSRIIDRILHLWRR